ncbi:MAG: response regulator transcription factor [Thermomicrobiales bacterium]
MSTTPDATASGRENSASSPSSRSPLNIVLVNEHRLFRHGLRLILEQLDPRYRVAGEVATDAEAIAQFADVPPHVVVLDLTWPDEALRSEAVVRIKRAFPETCVVVIAPIEAPDDVVRVIRAGANGYLTRSSSVDDVARAIETVETGGSWIAPELTPVVMAEYRKLAWPDSGSRRMNGELSARDREFLQLLASGQNNQQISEKTGLAASTVKNNLSALFRKLGVRDRTQAVIYAIENGIVAPGSNRRHSR